MIITRKTKLSWVLSLTSFEAINTKAFVSLSRPLGTGIAAVNKMLACSEEMEFLLPNVLGLDPKSPSSDWKSAVANYWHNFGLEVPDYGMPFDISLEVDVNDYRRKGYIDALLKELGLNSADLTNAAKEEAVVNYITAVDSKGNGKCPEELKFKYATPVNLTDYLAWRYCLVSSSVANEPEYIENSTRIKFFLLDESKAEARKAAIGAIRNKAIMKFSSLVSNKDGIDKIDTILIAFDKILSLRDLKAMSDGDKHTLLLNEATESPAKFIEMCENKNLIDIAKVKKYVMAGLINRLVNTTIHVDASDPTIVLGNSMNETISWLAATPNSVYANELNVKMKALSI